MFYKFKLSGVISTELEAMLFGDGDLITLKEIENHLKNASGQDIEVDLSSIGGLVDVGVDIFFAFRDYKRENPNAQMILNIKSQAASMASHIASGEFWDLVTVEDITTWMMHNPSNGIIGDYRVMYENAKFLERLSILYSGSYIKRSGKSEIEIRKMMDDTTYLFGGEIVTAGFADEVLNTDYEDKNKNSMIAKMQLRYDSVLEKIQQSKTQKEKLKKAAAKLDTEMRVGNYDANIKIIEQTWSKSDADKRWRSHTNAEDEPNSNYAKAFLWYDEDNADLFDSYKLQIKDYIDESEVVNIRAVNNASARLVQTQGPSSSEKNSIQKIIDKYQARWKKEQEKNMQQPAGGGNNKNKKEGLTMANTSEELKNENPALYSETVQAGKTEMIANNKAIMEFRDKEEYKNLPFIHERCDKAIMEGESFEDLKMAVMALMLDPKNQASIESPGDINTGVDVTMSGEQGVKNKDEVRW